MDREETRIDIDTDMNPPPAVALEKRTTNKKEEGIIVQEQAEERADDNEDDLSSRSCISLFDYSVENHFKAVDSISIICGEPETPDYDPAEIDRLSSSITFLREWRHFKYPSRTMRFACQNENEESKDVIDQITLPQFSSAAVPRIQRDTTKGMSSESCKDYVMYVGGPVWALDWCPRGNLVSDSHISTEFVAVAAHPPESSYHKIGAPLTGRGIIQIWCLLNGNTKKFESSHFQKKRKRCPKISEITKTKCDQPQKPRGRPRKYPANKDSNIEKKRGRPRKYPVNKDSNIEKKQRGRPRKYPVNKDSNIQKKRGRPRKHPVIESANEEVQPFATECEDSPALLSVDMANRNTNEHVSNKDSSLVQEASDYNSTSSKHKRSKVNITNIVQAPESALPLLMQDENGNFSSVNSQKPVSSDPDLMRSKDSVIHPCDNLSARNSIPEEVSLPRLMLCLAHNGKVAWDLKWCPNVYDKQRMGYLAVLLGNGALEVWEVPFPRTVKVIYSQCQKDGTDPRFIKLEPVFRCSTLKCGDRQSIPLTLEWSSSSPHNMILAGCHDGVVALWRFSPTGSSVDTRPLLCFSADTVPIRALAWAPVESYSESANVIVTAGHKGLKFWDIRDPFHSLWDFPLQKIIYGLDWLTDPSCIVACVEDGSLRFTMPMFSSNDTPVTGTPFVGTALKGFHCAPCSSCPIWSIQASKIPGFIAYCTADGNVLRFQMTAKAGDHRNRLAHFLCGAVNEEESTLTVVSALPDTPFELKKPLIGYADMPRSISGLVTKTYQEKQAKEKTAQDQTSSKSPGQGMKIGTGDTLIGQKNKQATEASSKRKSEAAADEVTPPCTDEEPASVEGGGGETVNLPSKIVAMHRVRWNKNQGSENWLCYGGAAGIVRCQEISICD